MVFLRFILITILLTAMSVTTSAQSYGFGSNPALWLRSDKNVSKTRGVNTPAANGDPVEAWRDYVSLDTARHVQFAAPTMDFTNTYNFHPVVHFANNGTQQNGSGSTLVQQLAYSGNVFTPVGSAGMTWYAVVRPEKKTTGVTQPYLPYLTDYGYDWQYGMAMLYSDDYCGALTPSINGVSDQTTALYNIAHNFGTKSVIYSQTIDFANKLSSVFVNGGVNGLSSSTKIVNASTIDATTIHANSTPTATSGPFTIGGRSSSEINNKNRSFNGAIAELIGFDQLLSASDQLNVQSYLALKYGITLAVVNYTLSGTQVYNSSTYTSCVAGLANDPNSALDQKISRSVNDTAIVTMSTSSDFVSGNEAASRNAESMPVSSSIVWGNDGDPSTLMQTALPVPKGYSRLKRTWEVQTAGTPSAVNIQVQINNPNFDLTSSDTTLYLVWDTQGDGIGINDSIIPMTKDAGDTTFSVLSVNLQNGQHFTLARAVPTLFQSPALWLRSDKNVASDAAGTVPAVNGDSVRFWRDFLTKDSASVYYSAPTFSTKKMYNFHPVLSFDNYNPVDLTITSPQSLMYSRYIFSKAGSDGMNWYVVVRPKDDGGIKSHPLVYNFGFFWGNAPNSSTVGKNGYGLGYSSYVYASQAIYNNWGPYTSSKGTQPVLLSQIYKFNNSATNQQLYLNGRFAASHSQGDLSAGFTVNNIAATPTPTLYGSGPFMIGCVSKTGTNGALDLHSNNGQSYYGDISEIIGFDGLLNSVNALNVQSYLAIKYGITLDTCLYTLNSDTVYQSSVYTSCIAGLANDTTSALDQKVSRSVNDTAIVTMSTSTDFISSNEAASRVGTSLPKNSSIIWGNDGDPTTVMQAALPPAGYSQLSRLKRIWEVQTTGTTSGVNIQVRINNPKFNLTSSDTTLVLVWDTQGTGIGTNDSIIPMVKDAGDTTFSVANVNLQNGQHFTLGRAIPILPLYKSPTLWLRSDVGVDTVVGGNTVHDWKDYLSADSADVYYTAPSYNSTDLYNFHSVVSFDNIVNGVTNPQSLRYSRPVFTKAGSTGMDWFVVTRPKQQGVGRTFPFMYSFGHFNHSSDFYATYQPNAYSSGALFTTAPNITVPGAGTQGVVLSQEYQFNNNTPNQIISLNGGVVGSTRKSDLTPGFTASTITYSAYPTINGTGPFMIGCQSETGQNNGSPISINLDNGRYYDGDIAEMIGFDGLLSNSDKLNVHSYLAIKYGITLDTAIYSLSNDTVYNSTVYTSCIAGLANDTASALDQKVSRSTNDTAIVTMSTSTDFVSSNEAASRNGTSLPKNTSIIWGNDGANNIFSKNAPLPAPVGYRRVNRTWEVQTSGVTPAVNIQVRINNPNFDMISTLRDTSLYLIWDRQGNGIDAADSIIPMIRQAGDTTYMLSNVNFQNGQHFTFARVASSFMPTLWLRSDKNVASDVTGNVPAVNGDSVRFWKDYVHADTAQVLYVAPLYDTKNMQNFHAVINFNKTMAGGLNRTPQSLKYSSYIYSEPASDGMNWFVVAKAKTTKSSAYPFLYSFGACGMVAHPLGYGATYSTTVYESYAGSYTMAPSLKTNNSPTWTLLSQIYQFSNSMPNSFLFKDGSKVASDKPYDLSSGFNSSTVLFAPTPSATNQAGPFAIGCSSDGKLLQSYSTYFNGDITEIIAFDGLLSDSMNRNVNTYLAIKYGMPLDTCLYTLGGDTVYQSNTYTSCIAGLANDTTFALDQKVSRSVNDSAIVTMSTSTDFVSSNEAAGRVGTSLPIGSSIIWGNDGDTSNAMQAALSVPVGYTRLKRTWEVQTTGTIPTMNIQVRVNNPSFDISTRLDTTLYLLWDTQGNGIDATDSIIPMTRDAGDTTFSVANVKLQNGQHFTLARAIPTLFKSPTLWLRADKNVASDAAGTVPAVNGDPVNYWKDYIHQDTASVIYNSPQYDATNMYNFHAVVAFNNLTNSLTKPQSLKYSSPIYSMTGSDGMNWFEVVRPKQTLTAITFPIVYNMGVFRGTNYSAMYSPSVYSSNALTTGAGATGTSAGTQPVMLSQEFQFNNSTPNQLIFLNGGISASINNSDLTAGFTSSTIAYTPTPQPNAGPFMIGCQSQTVGPQNRYYNGDMVEMIAFDGLLSASDKLNVHSYLAIKYGITLATAIYSLSNATVYNSSVYTSCIAGLANDTASALDQKVSRSVNDTAIVTMSTSTDFVSSNEAASRNGTSLPKNSSIIWGNDGDPNPSMKHNATVVAPAGYNRLARVWNVQTTNNPSAVNLQVNTKNPNFNFSIRGNLYLLWDKGGSGNWASATPVLMTMTSDSTYVASGIAFQNGDLFTFAQEEKGSWVGVNPALWLRADADVYSDRGATTKAVNGNDVYNWIDAVHADSARQQSALAPQYRDQPIDYYNFNPVLYFDNQSITPSQYHNLAYSRYIYTSPGSTGMTWLAIVRPDSSKVVTSMPYILQFGYANTALSSTSGTTIAAEKGYGFGYSYGHGNFNNWVLQSPYHANAALPTLPGKTKNNPVLVSDDINFGKNTSRMEINGDSIFQVYASATSISAANIVATPISNTLGGPVTIGSRALAPATSTYGFSFCGAIAEVVGFDGVLDSAQRNNAQSYLALKYGLTLHQNYTLRNTIVWDTTGWHNQDIAGLVRNDTSAIDQRVSRSVNPDAVVTMATSNDFVSLNTNPSRTQWTDKTSLIWGNDSLSDTTYYNNSTIQAPVDYARLSRTWKVQTTGNPGSVNIQVNTNNLNYNMEQPAGALYLLQANGTDFKTGTPTLMTESPLGSGIYQVSNINFSNGQLFSFATGTLRYEFDTLNISQVQEKDTIITLNLLVKGAPINSPLSLTLTYAGTAVSGTNYVTPANYVVTIPAGIYTTVQKVPFTIHIKDDGVHTPDKVILLTATSGSDLLALGDVDGDGMVKNTSTVTILDAPNTAALKFMTPLTNKQMNEGVTPTKVVAYWVDGLAGVRPITLDLSFAGLSPNPTNTADWQLKTQAGTLLTAPYSINIPAGKMADTLLLYAIDDKLYEGTERMSVMGKVSSSTPRDSLNPKGDSLSILDAQQNVAIAITTQADTVKEGSKVWVKLSLPVGIRTQDTITAKLTHPASGSSSTCYKNKDYTLADTIRIFPTHSQDSIWMNALTDQVIENREKLVVVATGLKGPNLTQTFSIGIIDTNSVRNAQLIVDKKQINEGDVAHAYLKLQPGMTTDVPISFYFNLDQGLRAGNALLNTDYTIEDALGSSKAGLTIDSGATKSDTFYVHALYDNLYEVPESIILTSLDTVASATQNGSPIASTIHITPVPDTVWIMNVDTTGGSRNLITPVKYEIVADTLYESEQTQVKVTLPGVTIPGAYDTLYFNVNYNASLSTAPATRYSLSNTVLKILPGNHSGAVNLSIPVNGIKDPIQILYLGLTTNDKHLNITPAIDSVRIIDVDGVSLRVDTTEVKEGGRIAVFATVGVGSGYSKKIYIDLSQVGGSASNQASANDYTMTGTRLTLSPRRLMSDTVYINALHDNVYEPTETLYLQGSLSQVPSTGVLPRLLNSPQELHIYDQDTTGGGSRDTTDFTLHVDKHDVNEGSSAHLWVTLPGTKISQDTTYIDLSHPGSGISGGKAQNNVDYTLGNLLKIYPGQHASDTIPLHALYDNIFEHKEYVQVTGKIGDLYGQLKYQNPATIYIHNVDTVGGAHMVDSIHVYASIDLDTMIGGDTSIVTIKLPGTTILARDGEPMPFKLSPIEGTITTETMNPILGEYDLHAENAGKGSLLPGGNSMQLHLMSMVDNYLEVLEWLSGTVISSDSLARIQGVPDTVYILDAGVVADSNLLILKSINDQREVDEGDSVGIFVLIDHGHLAGQDIHITLDHPLAGSLATEGLDYTLGHTFLIPWKHATSDTLWLKAKTDQVIEGTEPVVMKASCAQFPANKFADSLTINILDKTPVGVTLKFLKDSVLEGNNVWVRANFKNKAVSTAPYGVSLAPIVRPALYGVADSSDFNYVLGSNVIMIKAGKNADSVLLHAINDSLFEGNETLTLEGTFSAGKTNRDSVVIIDAQTNALGGADLKLTSYKNILTQGDSGGIILSFVDSSITAGVPMRVVLNHNNYMGVAAATYPRDYNLPFIITIPIGSKRDTVIFNANKNNIVQGTQYVTIDGRTTWTNDSLLNSEQQFTINDPAPINTVTLTTTVSKDSMYEQDDSLWVKVALPDSLVAGTDIHIHLTDLGTGTATAGLNYDFSDSDFTILAGKNADSILVLPYNDMVYKRNMSVIFQNSNTEGYVMVNALDSFHIVDMASNSTGGVDLSFQIDSTQITEGGAYATGTVSISGASAVGTALPFVIKYLGDDATLSDYTLTDISGNIIQNGDTVNIKAGAGTRKIRIYATGNNVIKGNRWLRLGVTPVHVQDAMLPGLDQDTVEIMDAQANPYGGADLTFKLKDKYGNNLAEVTEGDTLKMIVAIAGGLTSSQAILVQLDTLGYGLNPASPIRYQLLGLPSSLILTIPANTKADTLLFVALKDRIYQGDEQVQITGTPVDGRNVITPTNQIITIHDANANPQGGADLVITKERNAVLEGDSIWIAVSLKGGITTQNPLEITLKDITIPGINTASPSDFTLDTLFTIPAGKSSDTLILKALSDNIAENTELLNLLAQGFGAFDNIDSANQDIYILDNTKNRQIALLNSLDTVREGDSMYVYAELQNNIIAGFPVEISLQYPYTGTAAQNVDYRVGPATNTLLTIPEGAFRSDSIKIKALKTNVYKRFPSIVIDTLGLADHSFTLQPAPDTVWIQNTDPMGNDTTLVTFSIKADTLLENTSTTVTASLPAGVKAGADIIVYLEHPYGVPSPNDPRYVDSTGYTLAKTITIKKNQNSGSVALKALRDTISWHDSIQVLHVNAYTHDPYLKVQGAPDSVLTVHLPGVFLNIDTTALKEGEWTGVYATTENLGFDTTITVDLSRNALLSTADTSDYYLWGDTLGNTLLSTLTIPAHAQSSDTIYLRARWDNIYEQMEHLALDGKLTIAGNGVPYIAPPLLGSPVEVDIYDVDTTGGRVSDTTYFTMHYSSDTIYEGDTAYVWSSLPGSRISQDSLHILLDHPGNGTADPNQGVDYTLGDTLTFLPGSHTSDTIMFIAMNTNVYTPTKTVMVTGDFDNAQSAVLLNNPDTLHILNVDTTSGGGGKDSISVYMSVDKDTVIRGDSTFIRVHLPGNTVAGQDMKFDIKKIGGNALTIMESISDYDFRLNDSIIVIKKGQNSAFMKGTTRVKNQLNGIENIIFTLLPRGDNHVKVRNAPDTVYLVDPTVINGNNLLNFIVGAHRIGSGDSVPVYVTILGSLVAGHDMTITIEHPDTAQTAQEFSDYVLPHQVLIKQGSNLSDTIYLHALLNNVIEPDLSVILHASCPTVPDSLIKNQKQTVIIYGKEDFGKLQVSIARDTVWEGDSVQITASLGGLTTNRDIYVKISYDPYLSNIDPNDYVLADSILIKKGDTSGSIWLYAIDDHVYEGSRQLHLRATVLQYDSTDLELQGSPLSVTIMDPRGNAAGGAFLDFHLPTDSVWEGDSIPLIISLRNGVINGTSDVISGTLQHPFTGSTTTRVHYILSNSFAIAQGQSADTLWMHALRDGVLEGSQYLVVKAATDASTDSILPLTQKIKILDYEEKIAPVGGYVLNMSLSVDTVEEGNSMFVIASMPDSITTTRPVQIILTHPLSGSAVKGINYIMGDTITIQPGMHEDSIKLRAIDDYKYEGFLNVIIGAHTTHPDFQVSVIDTPLEVTISDREAKEIINASDFSWKLKNISSLNDVSARTAANVNGTDAYGNIFAPQAVFRVDQAQLGVIKAGSPHRVYPLTFYTPSGKDTTIHVILTVKDSIHIDTTDHEIVGANNFAWKWVDRMSLDNFTAIAAANAGASTWPGFLPLTVSANASDLNAIYNTTGTCLMPITFSTVKGSSTTISVVLSINDTTIIDPDLGEAITANGFKWKIPNLSQLDENTAVTAAHAAAFDLNTGSSILVYTVGDLLDSLQTITIPGVYPLTYTTDNGTSLTVGVTLSDNDSMIVYPNGTIGADNVYWKLQNAAQFNGSILAVDTAHVVVTRNGAIYSNSHVIPNSSQVAAIQNVQVDSVMPLIFYVDNIGGDSVTIHVTLTSDSHVVPANSEWMGANDFSWNLDSVVNLDSMAARIASRVNVLHYDNTKDAISSIVVGTNDQLGRIRSARIPGAYPLTFTSQAGTQVTVNVVLSKYEVIIDSISNQAITASNFIWSLADVSSLDSAASRSASMVKAYDLTVVSDIPTDAEIPSYLIGVDPQELDTLQTQTQVGVFPLTFSTTQGVGIAVKALLYNNQVITATDTEVIGANNFSWNLLELAQLNANSSILRADAKVVRFNGGLDSASTITVNNSELQAIIQATDAGDYPLTFTSKDGISVTIQVTVIDDRFTFPDFKTDVSITIPPQAGCPYQEPCLQDQAYNKSKYYGLDTMKNRMDVCVEMDGLIKPVDSLLVPITFQSDPAGADLTGLYYLEQPLILNSDDSTTSSGCFTVIRNTTNPKAEGRLFVKIKIGDHEQTLVVKFSDDFDKDGFSNEEERTTCVKTTNGIYNEWYYHRPQDDADGDGISNLVESGNNWSDLYNKFSSGGCTPDFLNPDSNGDGVPDSVEKFTNNTDSIDIHVRPAISPNGDNLGDDQMYIENINKFNNVDVTLFDRVGHVIYKESNYNNKDKAFKGYPNQSYTSKLVPIGTYYYYIKYEDPKTGARKEKSGFIEVRY